MPIDISFNHQMSFLTARIRIEIGEELSLGSGFFILSPFNNGSDDALLLLVSNKHVFKDTAATIKIDLNIKKDDGTPDFGNILEFEKKDFSSIYYPHPDPDVDLACINVSTLPHDRVYKKHLDHVFLKDIDYNKIAPGSPILFVGYPQGRFDTVNNLPIIRSGTLASMPDIDFEGLGQILIDAQVFQGSSGSPVFTHYDNTYVLLGVLTSIMIRNSRLQVINSSLSDYGIQTELGLGFVIKQRHVKELIQFAAQQYLMTQDGSDASSAEPVE